MIGQLASVVFALFFVAASIGALIGTIRGMQEKGMRLDAMLAWLIIPASTYFLAEANLGEGVGTKAAAVAAVVMLGSLYRPGRSMRRLHLIIGLSAWMALATCVGVLLVLIALFKEHNLRIAPTILETWPIMLATLGAWSLSKMLWFYAATSVQPGSRDDTEA